MLEIYIYVAEYRFLEKYVKIKHYVNKKIRMILQYTNLENYEKHIINKING